MFAILCIIGTWLGFANPLIQIPPLVICLPLLLVHYSLRSKSIKYAMQKGWIFGSLIYALCLYWVAYPVYNYTNVPLVVAICCPILLGTYVGLYPAMFCGAFWYIKNINWFLRGIVASTVWSSLEYLREYLFTGFLWLNITQAFAPWPRFIQVIQILGSILFSGIIICVAVWLYEIKNKKIIPPITALFFLILIYLIGTYLYNCEFKKGDKVPSLIVQGNIDQYQKWDKKFQKTTLDKYIHLTNSHLDQNIKLIIWPETAMPFYIQEKNQLTYKLLKFVKQKNIILITGAPAYKLKGKNINWYNRAYLLADGKIVCYYDKIHLVPFGEYIPLANLFPFLTKLVKGPGDFFPGNGLYPLKIKDLAIGTLICYEITFPDLVTQMILNKGELLVNISNDAWFGNSSGPYQHLNQAIVRAIEVKRYVLRSTNTGISAIISPKGEVKKIIALNKEGAIGYNQVYLISHITFFVRFHNQIKILTFLITGLSFIIIKIKGNELPW